MTIHELKIKEEYYKEVLSGRKTFELRKNDRNYQEGDLIQFKKVQWLEPTGDLRVPFREVLTFVKELYQITYILKDVPQYGLDKEYCILGIKRVEIKEV